jgi:tRNA threonylcarbamoyladenosine biosynthesis protein TsaB
MVLGFDTATPVTTIGISSDKELVDATSFLSDKTQTEQLMPALDAMLKKAGLTIHDIEGLAVGLGPGLFTSSRIGVMTAKSLAYALEVPIVGISSLDTIARGAADLSERVVSVIDARRREVFVATYDTAGGKLDRTMQPAVMSPQDLNNVLQELKKPVILAGNGAVVYREKLEDILPEGCSIAPDKQAFPDAAHLLGLAADRFEAGETDDLNRFVPIYIRHADAKVFKTKRDR